MEATATHSITTGARPERPPAGAGPLALPPPPRSSARAWGTTMSPRLPCPARCFRLAMVGLASAGKSGSASSEWRPGGSGAPPLIRRRGRAAARSADLWRALWARGRDGERVGAGARQLATAAAAVGIEGGWTVSIRYVCGAISSRSPRRDVHREGVEMNPAAAAMVCKEDVSLPLMVFAAIRIRFANLGAAPGPPTLWQPSACWSRGPVRGGGTGRCTRL